MGTIESLKYSRRNLNISEELERTRRKGARWGSFKIRTYTNQRESEVKVEPRRDGRTSSWKRVEIYRINKPSQHFRKKNKKDIYRS
jgi:hypothetical protein